MSQQEQEGVLSRWSRRKLQTQEETKKEDKLVEATEQDSLDIQAPAVTVEPQGEDSPETPVLTDEDMPAIESLDENSDFSMFMSSGVSDKLRNLALRKMFHAPVFNIRDGLDEYDEDYTYFEKLGDIVTCDMKHQLEMLEKKKREEAEAKALTDDEAIEDKPVESTEQIPEGETAGEDPENDQEKVLLDDQLTDENSNLNDKSESPKVLNRNEANSYE